VVVPNALNALSKADLRKIADKLKDEIREVERGRS
jgi:hypothetical protein